MALRTSDLCNAATVDSDISQDIDDQTSLAQEVLNQSEEIFLSSCDTHYPKSGRCLHMSCFR